MGRRMLLKDAAGSVGLSMWELRSGFLSGKYPGYRLGNPKTGKMVFDVDLLEARIRELMLANLKSVDVQEYGVLRRAGDER